MLGSCERICELDSWYAVRHIGVAPSSAVCKIARRPSDFSTNVFLHPEYQTGKSRERALEGQTDVVIAQITNIHFVTRIPFAVVVQHFDFALRHIIEADDGRFSGVGGTVGI